MFGVRVDGRAIRHIDPITKMTPLIMSQRCDAQVFTTQYADSSIISEYIRQKREQGVKISHMALVLAAYVRTVSQRPELNRFVCNGKLYVRNDLTVSFAVLKKRTADVIEDTTVKIHFDPAKETIFTVNEKVEKAIAENAGPSNETLTDKVASAIFAIPLLPKFIVGIIKLLDRWGILPKALVEVSPFHTSMFITNMASIKMSKVYHHIYNFGTTSVFVGMGKKDTIVEHHRDGTVTNRPVIPLGVTIDERIAPGAVFAMALHQWEVYMRNPERLEQPPESVRYDDGLVYPKPKKK